MRLILLVLLAEVAAGSTIIGRIKCPAVGYSQVGYICIRNSELGIPDEKSPAAVDAVEDKCVCVPFYQCGLDVRNDGCNCKAGEISCKKGVPADECGWGAIGSSANETDHGEFPWIVAILNVTTNETWTRDEYIGGGSIVHPRYELTAAHKVNKKNQKTMKCRAGQLMRLTPEPNVTQDRLVVRIIVHQAYDRQYLANDIALIELKEPFDVSQLIVRPVCVGNAPPRGPRVAPNASPQAGGVVGTTAPTRMSTNQRRSVLSAS